MAKNLVSKLFLLLIALVIALLGAEGLSRLFSNVTKVYFPATWTSPDIFIESKAGFSLLPSRKAMHYGLHNNYTVEYTSNSQGIRSEYDYQMVKPADTKRIFLLGDSLAFGIGVNDHEALAPALEDKLNAADLEGIDYEVLNLGVTGYTFDNYYMRLKRYLEFKPDLIIIVALGVNDFLDILDHDWVLDKNRDIVEVKENFRHIDQYNRLVNGPKILYKKDHFIIERVREFLRSHSVLYTFLGTLRYRNQHRTVEIVNRREDIETEIKGVSLAIEALDKLFDLAERNQIKTLFILEGFYKDKIKKEFLSYLTKKTDLIIDMDNFNKQDGLYIPLDGHWSASGNKYIAGIVLEYIRERRVL